MSFDFSHVPPAQFFTVMAVFVAGLAILIAAVKVLKLDRITAPRAPRANMPDLYGKQWQWTAGTAILNQTCPACRQETRFYSGPARHPWVIVYCGREDCRAGFQVTNYGDGAVWADRAEDGPDRLYATGR